ncbi:MAG: dTDP-4-dehydrorhamnose reductase [Planctomycetota bacterium]
MTRRVMILGAGGQLGREMVRLFESDAAWRAVAFDRNAMDITDPDRVRRVIGEIRPAAVVNAAAYNHVDKAEEESEEAFRVNAGSVRALAEACAREDAVLVHVSTNYVFDGRKNIPYTEDDPPAPLSVYAASKLAGEAHVRSLCPRHFVIRTAAVFGPGGRLTRLGNFIETMIRVAAAGKPLRVVADQVVTPTSAGELAGAIRALLGTDRYGMYHVTGGGETSWHGYAEAVFSMAGIRADLTAVTTKEFGAKAARPPYSVLDCGKLVRAGIPAPRPWREAVGEYLESRKAFGA